MGRVSTAFRAFWRSCFDAEVAARVENALHPGKGLPTPPSPHTPSAPVAPQDSTDAKRIASELAALSLLSTLQREARLIDFLQEDLSGYEDGQIGAAVRDIHRETRQVLERLFAIRPLVDHPEDTLMTLPKEADLTHYRLTGQARNQEAPQGYLRHKGWQATKCDLPKFTGTESSARIVAPAEVEMS